MGQRSTCKSSRGMVELDASLCRDLSEIFSPAIERHRQVRKQLLPAPHGKIDVNIGKLDCPNAAPGALAGDDGCSRAAKRLKHNFMRIGVSFHHKGWQPPRKNSRMWDLDPTLLMPPDAERRIWDFE